MTCEHEAKNQGQGLGDQSQGHVRKDSKTGYYYCINFIL